jgi:hypothetical protein
MLGVLENGVSAISGPIEVKYILIGAIIAEHLSERMATPARQVKQTKNPAEHPASRSNSGAGTEKRPYLDSAMLNGLKEKSSRKSKKTGRDRTNHGKTAGGKGIGPLLPRPWLVQFATALICSALANSLRTQVREATSCEGIRRDETWLG